MTAISAAMVKQLRDATSAGMMDCKRALVETNGDFDEAVKILRERGMASAAKRADRATSEGKVGVMVRENVGATVAIGCETEPVSNNDEFLAYAENVLKAVFDGGDASALEEERVNLTAKLGENIQVVGTKRMDAGDGELLSYYVHGPANKVGALVRTKGGDAAVARSLALHLTFARPTYGSRDERGEGRRDGARERRRHRRHRLRDRARLEQRRLPRVCREGSDDRLRRRRRRIARIRACRARRKTR